MKRTGCVKTSDNTEQMFGYEKVIFWVVEKESKELWRGGVGVVERGCRSWIEADIGVAV